MNKVVVFNDLVGMLAKSANTSQSLTDSFLRELLALMSERLEKGERVVLCGIGEFFVDNGDIKFIPEKKLAEDVNYAFDCFEPVELDDEYSDDTAIEENLHAEAVISSELVEKNDEQDPCIFEAEQQKEDGILPPPVPEEDRVKTGGSDSVASEPPAVPDENETVKETEVEVPPVPDYLLANEDTQQEAESEDYASDEDEPKRDWRMFVYGVLAGIVVTIGASYFLNRSGFSNEDGIEEVGFDSIAPLEKVVVAKDTVKPDSVIAKVDSVNIAPIIYKVENKSSYLSNISRKYYDHYIFWIYIYLENKEKIKDPDNLVVGMELVIPPAEKYGIDKEDPKSIERAEAEIEKNFGKKKK